MQRKTRMRSPNIEKSNGEGEVKVVLMIMTMCDKSIIAYSHKPTEHYG